MVQILVQIIFILFSAVFGFMLGGSISYSDLSPSISILQNLSAAVLTIAGLWVAYIYPQAIAAYKSGENVKLMKGVESTERIEELIMIIIISASVLVVLLFSSLIWSGVKELSIVKGNYVLVKKLCVTVFFYVCLVQSATVFKVIISNIRFVNELHRVKRDSEAHNEL